MEKYLLLTDKEIEKLKELPGFSNNVHKMNNFRKMYNTVYFVNESWFNEDKENLKIDVNNCYLLNDDEIIAVTSLSPDDEYNVIGLIKYEDNISISEYSISKSEFNKNVTKKLSTNFFNETVTLFNEYSDYKEKLDKILQSAND